MAVLLGLLLMYRRSQVPTALATRGVTVQIRSCWTNVLDRSFRAIGIGVATGAPAGSGVLPALTITTDFGVRSG